MTGPTLFMLIFRKLSPVTVLNHFENQLLQLPPLMPTSSTAWPLVRHLQHVTFFAINRLVLQKTSNCGNSNIWIRVCGSQDSHRTYHGYKIHSEVPWNTHQVQIIYIWDNSSVVTSTTLPHSTFSKRHNILAFHRVTEAIAAKIIDFHWSKSEYNLGDMLSKHWECSKIFPMIQKLLITCGPIILIPKSATEETFKPP